MDQSSIVMLDFLVATCAELSVVANKSELPVIAYLLQLATLEAEMNLTAAAPSRRLPKHPLWDRRTAAAVMD